MPFLGSKKVGCVSLAVIIIIALPLAYTEGGLIWVMLWSTKELKEPLTYWKLTDTILVDYFAKHNA